jgi:ACS family tartrate transporter-like MFS transporter
MTDTAELLTMRRVAFRLLPLLFSIYLVSYLDRNNIGLAALQMNSELGFGPAVFGFGAGIFYLGYAAFEVPSNLILVRVGVRRWISRIAITWGLVACAMMWVRTPSQFYWTRFLLGLCEAGYFPAVLYYINQWFPAPYRARALAAVTMGIPVSAVLGNAVGGLLLDLGGLGQLAGWQWLFLIEGLPPILLGIAALRFLTERPDDAGWLTVEQRSWLRGHIEEEQRQLIQSSVLRALTDPRVWALAVPYFALFAVGNSYASWAPTLVRSALGTSNAITGFVVAGIALLALPVYPLAGWLSDRSGERCKIAALGLALHVIGCLGLAAALHPWVRVLSLALLPLGVPIMVSSFWCLPSKLLKGPAFAAGIALISSIGTTGGFFGPSIIGYLKQATGGDTGAFVGLAGLSLAGLLVCMAVGQTRAFKPHALARAP